MGQNVARAYKSISVDSLQQIHGAALSLSSWTTPEDFFECVPAYFTEPVSSDGKRRLSELSETLHPLMRAIYFHAQLGLLQSFHALYKSIREPALSLKNLSPTVELQQLVEDRAVDVVITDACSFVSPLLFCFVLDGHKLRSASRTL